MDYYYVHTVDEEWVPVAHGAYDPARNRALFQPTRVERWEPLRLRVESGKLVDQLPSNVGGRFCSERMRAVIDQHRGPLDELEWLPATVVDNSGVEHPYWVLHLLGESDFVDRSSSIMVRGFVVKAVLDSRKVAGRHLLRFSGDSQRWIVSDQLRSAFAEAGCVGLTYTKVPVVLRR
jgi:hypothetical protein